MKKLTTLGYMTGVLIILASVIRWFIMFNDISQLTLGIGMGFLILAGAYFFQTLNNHKEEIDDLHKGLDLQNMWIREELDKRPVEDKK